MIARLFFVFIVTLATINIAYAGEIISATQALEKMQSDQMVLIDIRSPAEWNETGIASAAIPLSIHEKGFLEGLEKIRLENPGKLIGLICATGGRSARIQGELEKRNLGSVVDVSEGMLGNSRGEGWIKRGLPVTKIR